MRLHGFFIHPHTALYVNLEGINLSQSASDMICDPPAQHLLAHWPWSFTEHSFHSLQVGLFTSQSRLLCQESFNSGLLECHSRVSPRPYRSSHLYKRNCFAMQCGESHQTNRTTEGWRYAHLLGIFLLASLPFLSLTYKVSLNMQQDRTLLYLFSLVENSWPLLLSWHLKLLLLLFDDLS